MDHYLVSNLRWCKRILEWSFSSSKSRCHCFKNKKTAKKSNNDYYHYCKLLCIQTSKRSIGGWIPCSWRHVFLDQSRSGGSHCLWRSCYALLWPTGCPRKNTLIKFLDYRSCSSPARRHCGLAGCGERRRCNSALPHFVKLLRSPDHNVCEQVKSMISSPKIL